MRFTSILIQESSNTKVEITYMAAGSECVRVIVRCRPMNARENQLTSKVIFFLLSSPVRAFITEWRDSTPDTQLNLHFL